MQKQRWSIGGRIESSDMKSWLWVTLFVMYSTMLEMVDLRILELFPRTKWPYSLNGGWFPRTAAIAENILRDRRQIDDSSSLPQITVSPRAPEF